VRYSAGARAGAPWISGRRFMFTLGAALVTFLLGTGEGLGDRYRLELSDLPPIFVEDSLSYGISFRPHRGFVPPSADLGFVPPAGSATAGVSIAMPVSQNSSNRVEPPGPYSLDRPEREIDAMVDPTLPGPTPQFVRVMNTVHSTTDPRTILAIWKWYLEQEPTLGFGEKTGNSILACSMAVGRPLCRGQMAWASPLATRGTITSPSGLGTRFAPWGPSTTTRYPKGATVDLSPPMEDGWFKVTSPSSWINGLWFRPD
jgi:hypothetical protein